MIPICSYEGEFMFTEERHKKIITLLEANKRMTTKELANILNVSIDSIRRDFITLENRGLLQRTHGGAILKQQSLIYPPPPNDRYSNIDNETYSIAKSAVQFIKEKETIFISGSSVHYAMTDYLPNHIQYTVVTNSSVIAEKIKSMDNIHLILIGGTVKESGNMTDTIALNMIQLFHFDICFITCGGFNGDVLSTTSTDVALFNQNIIKNSTRKIALVPHSKMNRTLFSKIANVESIDIIITDSKAKQKDLSMITTNLELIIAK
ncbi:DeoR family transcriptional regulator [Macrococcus epidermidis]|uniref:DeoR family transcriptional regulator n=2 Tax=Macrococcus epidermidis TaxID=1902580 RepID=A0A327ZQB0_9STAP|nr:DeoR family transcriptional regulator [Macrococcus epidermidis]